MAKKSWLERNKRKSETVKKFAAKRAELGIQGVVVSGKHETAAHGHRGSAEVAETGFRSPDSLI